jgi:hypothetical protein
MNKYRLRSGYKNHMCPAAPGKLNGMYSTLSMACSKVVPPHNKGSTLYNTKKTNIGGTMRKALRRKKLFQDVFSSIGHNKYAEVIINRGTLILQKPSITATHNWASQDVILDTTFTISPLGAPSGAHK